MRILWNRLPQLPRAWKIARNFAAAVVIPVLLWGKLSYPMPSPELDFRRAEQAAWVGPSDIQLLGDENWQGVGTYRDQVLIQRGKYDLDYWPRNGERPTLVPCYGAILGVDPPKNTVSARLKARVSYYCLPRSNGGTAYASRERAQAEARDGEEPEYREESCTVVGIQVEEGGILFSLPQAEELEAAGNESGRAALEDAMLAAVKAETYRVPAWDREARVWMEAVFYDGEGRELARTELKTQG